MPPFLSSRMAMTVTLPFMADLRVACEEVDVVVALGCSGEEHAMWMESRGRDSGAAVSVHPPRIWLNSRELLPFEVEDLDSMFRSSAFRVLADASGKACMIMD